LTNTQKRVIIGLIETVLQRGGIHELDRNGHASSSGAGEVHGRDQAGCCGLDAGGDQPPGAPVQNHHQHAPEEALDRDSRGRVLQGPARRVPRDGRSRGRTGGRSPEPQAAVQCSDALSTASSKERNGHAGSVDSCQVHRRDLVRFWGVA